MVIRWHAMQKKSITLCCQMYIALNHRITESQKVLGRKGPLEVI